MEHTLQVPHIPDNLWYSLRARKQELHCNDWIEFLIKIVNMPTTTSFQEDYARAFGIAADASRCGGTVSPNISAQSSTNFYVDPSSVPDEGLPMTPEQRRKLIKQRDKIYEVLNNPKSKNLPEEFKMVALKTLESTEKALGSTK